MKSLKNIVSESLTGRSSRRVNESEDEVIEAFLNDWVSDDELEDYLEVAGKDIYVTSDFTLTPTNPSKLKDLTNPKYNLRQVYGLDLSGSNISSLKGCPEDIGVLEVRDCKRLKNFKGMEKVIDDGSFGPVQVYASGSGINSLEGLPQYIQYISCEDCKGLKSLKGCPDSIISGMNFSGCSNLVDITSHLPSDVGSGEDFVANFDNTKISELMWEPGNADDTDSCVVTFENTPLADSEGTDRYVVY